MMRWFRQHSFWGQTPRRGIAIWLFLLALPAQAGQIRVLFYDPDANLAAVENITRAFDQFLGDIAQELSFQPINDLKTFKQQLAKPDVGFVIVASSVLRELKQKNFAVSPVVVQSSQGSQYYTRLLLQRAGATRGDLRGQSIAGTAFAAAAPEAKKRILDELRVKGEVNLEQASLIPVSKDIDAVLALAFGQVQAALVTHSSLEMLSTTMPAARSSVQTVYESDKILRAPLAVLDENVSPRLVNRMKQAFLAMETSQRGKSVLSALGCDTWVPLSAGELSP